MKYLLLLLLFASCGKSSLTPEEVIPDDDGKETQSELKKKYSFIYGIDGYTGVAENTYFSVFAGHGVKTGSIYFITDEESVGSSLPFTIPDHQQGKVLLHTISSPKELEGSGSFFLIFGEKKSDGTVDGGSIKLAYFIASSDGKLAQIDVFDDSTVFTGLRPEYHDGVITYMKDGVLRKFDVEKGESL